MQSNKTRIKKMKFEFSILLKLEKFKKENQFRNS